MKKEHNINVIISDASVAEAEGRRLTPDGVLEDLTVLLAIEKAVKDGSISDAETQGFLQEPATPEGIARFLGVGRHHRA